MSNKNLVYDVTDWQRQLWSYQKMVDPNAKDAEREGRKRYSAFNDFSAEIFHRMFAEKPDKLETPAPGSEIFQTLHNRMDEIPEIETLRQKSCGNETWSGVCSTAIMDTLLSEIPKPDEKVEDIRGDAEVEKFFREAIENAENDQQRRELQEQLDEELDPNNPNGLAARRERAENAANGLDDTQIRNALRNAAQKASDEISEQEAILDSLSFGMDPHSGKKASMAIHKKIAEVLKKNKRVAEIARLAGRLRRIAMEQQRQKPQKGTDEVAGIEIGADLSRMVPAEALFMDDEIDAVFATKLHEQSLAQFELSKVPKKEQGPIVMLLDSSGSMAGGPDLWAAAVALAFLEIAFKQKRAFAVVFFGSGVLKEEIFSDWSNVDHEKILETISFFAADGGTVFEEPLMRAVDIIENTGAFEAADIVMVTDGVASVSDSFLAKWNAAKDRLSFLCYSILVGSYTDVGTNEKFSDEVELLNDVIRNDEGMHKFFTRV